MKRKGQDARAGSRPETLERMDYARERLFAFTSDADVARELMAKYGVSRTAAWEVVRKVWDEHAVLRGKSVAAKSAALTHRLQHELAELHQQPTTTTHERVERARAVAILSTLIAKINGCFPESRRAIATAWSVLSRNEAREFRRESAVAVMMSGDELERAFAEEERRVGLGVSDDDLAAIMTARFGEIGAHAVHELASASEETALVPRPSPRARPAAPSRDSDP